MMQARWAGLAAITAILLGVTAVVAWQVLRPAEVSTPATTTLPKVVAQPEPGGLGILVSAPLVIDDRIRVYAKKREVWADGPPSSQYERSAYWAYRRWPAEVTGILAANADRPLIVSAWSDGVLVAVEAETGDVAWRVEGGEPLAEQYDGRRTGAETVYHPPGLYAAGQSTFITVGEQITARSVASGQTLWTAPLPDTPECLGDTFTTTGGHLLLHNKCTETLTRLEVSKGHLVAPPMPAEAVEPVSCRVGHSDCVAMRVTTDDGVVSGYLLTGAAPAALPLLDAPRSLYDGQNVLVPEAGLTSLSAVDPDGQVLWTWRPAASGPFLLLSADRTRVLLLESDSTLVSLDPATGRLRSHASLLMQHEPQRPYDVRDWYVSGSYVVLERTNPDASSVAGDEEYYYTNRPILIASAGA
jgi:outer membrane protein assembly factor BamB